MKHQKILLEGNDGDALDPLAGELDLTKLRRDYGRERRFRLQALERLPSDEAQIQRLRNHADEAARLLRVALADAAEYPRMPYLAVRAVLAARGSVGDLGLTLDEMTALLELSNLETVERAVTQSGLPRPNRRDEAMP